MHSKKLMQLQLSLPQKEN